MEEAEALYVAGDGASSRQAGNRATLERHSSAPLQVADPDAFGLCVSQAAHRCAVAAVARQLCDDPIFQLAKAYRYNKSLVGRPDTSGHARKTVARKVGTGARLRVGYVSSDLRDHAVGFALREVLELHDKDRVEIYAYYCGDPVINDPTQNRMKAAIDCWREIGQMTDEDAARLIASDDIDI